MEKKMAVRAAAVLLLGMMLAGCAASGSAGVKKVKLDPDQPVSLTLWHYYNGTQQATFDRLIEEFNATVGKDEGIYVEGYSQGSVSDLEKAITSALHNEVGADDLPDMFSSYADTAYAVQKRGMLVDLTDYFSADELADYVDSYIQEGYFNDDGALYLLPVAKSTEIMMLNKTDWEPFAEETGATLAELSTVEGIIDVAERYYKWTDAQTPDVPDDGKAFYGRDAMANYFVIGMRQMGKEIFEVKDGSITFHTDKKLIRRLWDDYYVPYIKGYFGAYGKFRSDDVKTGDILAYTGSTASSFYFPDEVEKDNNSYPIDFVVMPAPVMEGGDRYNVQQGAGIAVTKSDESHEYASAVFLKWFTQKEQNLQFVCESGYMPVLKEANSMEALDQVLAEQDITMNEKAYACLETVLTDFDQTKFYVTKNFEHGYDARQVLEHALSDQAVADKEAIGEAVKAGTSRADAIAEYTSDETFDNWYVAFCEALKKAARVK